MDTLSAWSRALRDPSLRDLPYKIETNEYGQLVMSPQWPRHGHAQSRIDVLLSQLVTRPGRGAVEFAIETPKGVKLPDVVWISEERWSGIPADVEASPVAPEICIEVLSKSNTAAEIDEKRRLYFDRGALEVWTCDARRRHAFFHRLRRRARVPARSGFPDACRSLRVHPEPQTRTRIKPRPAEQSIDPYFEMSPAVSHVADQRAVSCEAPCSKSAPSSLSAPSLMRDGIRALERRE